MTAAAAAATPKRRYAPPDPTLPKPWRGLIDGKTGYLYFWNQDTNVTQYERPVAEPPLPTPSPAPSPPRSAPAVGCYSVQAQRPSDSSGQRDDDGGCGGPRSDQLQGAKDNISLSLDCSTKVGHESSAIQCLPKSAEAYRRQHEITVNAWIFERIPSLGLEFAMREEKLKYPRILNWFEPMSPSYRDIVHFIKSDEGNDVPPPYTTFESTGFPPEILGEVRRAGFSAPTPIQAQSWPIALGSCDIVAIAKTGSGKTLGYLIPGFIHLKRIRNDPKVGPTVLVLSPTRELATQIQDEAVKFGRSSRISSTCLYGGAPKGPQLRDLDRGVDVVVATPGRLNDILEMRRVSLHQVSFLVLDEADRMLDMGFEPQIRKIVKEIPPRRQTLMFTATWPKEVRKIAADLLVKPVQVNIGNIDELVANKSITQYVEVVRPMEKQRRLEQLLRSQEPGSRIIIFCSTKRMCDQLARVLDRQFGAAAIHGDKSQGERDSVLSQFRSGKSPILVATDVAARGLDVKDIRIVVNYDFPTGVEDYVHRIGRTGRGGATGISFTFFGDQDSKYASDLVKILEGANQRVPPELLEMVSRGGYGGKSRRFGSGRDGCGPNGGGGRSDSSYGGRSGGGWGEPISSGWSEGGGCGRFGGSDLEPSRDRYDRGYQDERTEATTTFGARSRSISPTANW